MATVTQETPPLVAGDKLTRAEFRRRWEAHPEIKLAELIGGIVYMPSPLSIEHGDTEADVGAWLSVYAAFTPGTKASHNATTLMQDDAPQPDVHLRILEAAGGQSSIEGKYLSGAPEMTTEVCRSSAAYDLHQKLELYQEAGVLEYVAVLLYEHEVRWHRLTDKGYELMPAGKDGIWRSQVFPGLWLNGPAFLAGNMVQVLATLQEGLNSTDHGEFVQRLTSGKA